MASVTAGAGAAIRIVRPDAHRVMPWKNGLGTTTEIAIDPPDGDVGGRFHWRLSIADVESSCPFSAFPGYERTIMVISGHGMDLAVGERPVQRLDRLFEPYVFSGDSAVECRLLDGPIRDFNLMVERASLRSRVALLRLEAEPQSLDRAAAERIIHCFEGLIDLALPATGWSTRLQPNCTAIVSRADGAQGNLQVVPGPGERAMAAIIELTAA